MKYDAKKSAVDYLKAAAIKNKIKSEWEVNCKGKILLSDYKNERIFY
jgi:hypothetical protein